jgi:hypothetical protein
MTWTSEDCNVASSLILLQKNVQGSVLSLIVSRYRNLRRSVPSAPHTPLIQSFPTLTLERAREHHIPHRPAEAGIQRSVQYEGSKVGSISYFTLFSQPGRIRHANLSFLSSFLPDVCMSRQLLSSSDLRNVGGRPGGM